MQGGMQIPALNLFRPILTRGWSNNFGTNGTRLPLAGKNSPGNTNWELVKGTIVESNKLIHESPDRTLHRSARLAKLPPKFWLILEEGRFTCVIFGQILPYVRQTGCITDIRSVLARFKEHLAKAKMLRNHLVAMRFGRSTPPMGFSSTPSLSRCLARNGPAGVSDVAVERVPEQTHGGLPNENGSGCWVPRATRDYLLGVWIP